LPIHKRLIIANFHNFNIYIYLMKNQFLFVCLLLVSSLFAQKVDLDSEPLSVHFRRMPSNPLPKDYKFYSSTLSANPKDIVNFGLRESFVLSHAKVTGYQQIKTGGDFNIEISLSDFGYVGTEQTKTNVTTTKDKAGKETTTTTYYKEVGFKQSVSVKVRDKDNKPLLNETYNKENQIFKSADFGSAGQLEEYRKNTLYKDVNVKNYESVTQALAQVKNLLANRFGFEPTKGIVKVEILDTEKHEDFAGFQAAYKTLKTGFEAMSPEKSLDSVKMLIKPSIDFFEKNKDKYKTDEKSGKKLRYACIYNLALINYWMEDFEASEKYANQLITDDYEPKDGKKMLKNIEEIKADLQKSDKKKLSF
jgi:hypothetical protein